MTPLRKKILILYTSVGMGHQTIAENIAWHLSREGFEVKIADIGKVQAGKFEHSVTVAHQFINKRLPFVWGWLYRFGHYAVLPFRIFIAGFNYKLAKSYIDDFKPSLIITTQTTASAVVAYLKKKNLYSGGFGIAFSDFHLHPYWLYDQADFYLANTDEQKQQMVNKGINRKIIFVCGITLKPKAIADPQEVKKSLGISQGQKVILVGTGSLGVGFNVNDLAALSKLKETKIIFVCGKNRHLYKLVTGMNYPNVITLGFYSRMDELYSIADIFVGKPGGLSTAEALQHQLPLMISFTLPGQEEKNYSYLVFRGLVMPRPQNLAEAVSLELHGHGFKKTLGENAQVAQIIGKSGVLVAAVKEALT